MIYVLLEYNDIRHVDYACLAKDSIFTALTLAEYKITYNSRLYEMYHQPRKLYATIGVRIDDESDQQLIKDLLAETLTYHKLAYNLKRTLITTPNSISYRDQSILFALDVL